MGSILKMFRDLQPLETFVLLVKSDCECAKVSIFNLDNILLLICLLLGLRQVSRLLAALHFMLFSLRLLSLSNCRLCLDFSGFFSLFGQI